MLISIYPISFRLIGLTRSRRPLARVCAESSPWIWTALIVLLVTGMLLTIAQPARELLNWMFRSKMMLVLTLALLIAWVQRHTREDPAYFESPGRRPMARAIGSLCIVMGAGLVSAGRWIAYV